MDDQTLIKAFLKKQKEIQDEFLARLNQYRAPVDTAELKKLVEEYKTAVYGAASIKPKLDTSTIDQTINQAVASALAGTNLSNLTERLTSQTRAIEYNSGLLAKGIGWKLKWLTTLLALIFGFMAGWGINWYFEIPKQLAGVSKYQTLQIWYDGINETMRKNCKLAKAYYAAENWKWNNQCGTFEDLTGKTRPLYPLKTSQDLISGN
jgi:hypothetical protein